MSREIEFISSDLALVNDGDLIINTGSPINLGDIKKSPVSPKPKDEGSDEIAIWGEENDYPQKIIEIAEKSTEIPSLLDWQARAVQGKNIVVGMMVFDEEKGKRVFKEVNDQEIYDFLDDSTFKRYMYEAALDFYWFANVFPELIKSVKGDKIVYLGVQDASFCRFSRMNNKGKIEFCYVSANWPNAKINDSSTTKLDVIDPYSVTKIEDTKNSKAASYIYPVSCPSPGKVYYQLAKWNGFNTTGWGDISVMVPNSKRTVMKKILSAKYILQIPLSYWPTVYKDWFKMSDEEKIEKKKKKVKEINDRLTGLEGAGALILTETGVDPETGQEVPSWKIEPISSATKEGENLEDSREASQHLMRALGVDPTLVGDGPGKSMGGGSGSDKRIAFNIYVALLQPHRNLILEPLDFVAEYNGWKKKYPGLKFMFEEVLLETLDNGNTSKPVTN